ncbi:helix-turn-helix domain-containing protein [Dyella sp. S184]|uniref:helix-turn-helix domain-containing protein n=1 Tax=Dyella sp. S184 TaxID=1641862 RepID=UPI00131D2069|nr:helix-turn-helix domain-containing protein [Dyella sp. S184]
MATRRTVVDAPRPLEALGIDEMEERAYGVLLEHRMATAAEVANLLSLSAPSAQRLLDSIELKGLVSHSSDRPRRYVAAPPELAVEALISQRQAGLEFARSAIPALKGRFLAFADPRENELAVEIIKNRAALSQIFTQVIDTTRSEILGFQRAPALNIAFQEVPKGVRVRNISDTGFLGLPNALELMRSAVENGEEARIFPALPVKMLIADQRIALIPLRLDDMDGPTLLVRASSLLDGLRSLFELTWERSTPVVFTRTGKLVAGKADARWSDAAEQIIPLLAAGLNDKAIAHEAGISSMTLTRRINELMKSFDTRTRFQLGWRAALDAFPNGLTPSSKARTRSSR